MREVAKTMENVLLPISVLANQDSQDQIVIEVGETEQTILDKTISDKTISD